MEIFSIILLKDKNCQIGLKVDPNYSLFGRKKNKRK